MVLLPEGKIINNPDTVKLIKVLPTTLKDETFFIVVIKMDDDSELMLERCATRMEAEALAERCCRLLNGEELDSVDIPSFVEPESPIEDNEESSEWDISEEDSIDEPTRSPSSSVEESSDWDLSSTGEDSLDGGNPQPEVEESSSWDMSESGADSVETTPQSSVAEEESSDWDLSSDAESSQQPESESEEESSSWGFSSEEDNAALPKRGAKPKIQKPYTEPNQNSESKGTTNAEKIELASIGAELEFTDTVEEASAENEVKPISVPRVTGFIEEDSDEWIPDNGLDDWYD